MTSTSHLHLLDIPVELILCVLEYLDSNDNLATCCACKTLRNASEADFLWNVLFEKTLATKGKYASTLWYRPPELDTNTSEYSQWFPKAKMKYFISFINTPSCQNRDYNISKKLEIILNEYDDIQRMPVKERKRKMASLQTMCFEGIPKNMRGKAYFILFGGQSLKASSTKTYKEYLNDVHNDHQKIINFIKCVKSEFSFFGPTRHTLDTSEGKMIQHQTLNIMKAYTCYRDTTLWTMQTYIPMFLLLTMDEEHAFWTYAAIMSSDKYSRYFGSSEERKILTDESNHKCEKAVQYYYPSLAKKIQRTAPDVYQYCYGILVLFIYRTFTHVSFTYRIWDVICLEGMEFGYAVFLALFDTKKDFMSFQGHCSQFFHNFSKDDITPDKLIKISKAIWLHNKLQFL